MQRHLALWSRGTAPVHPKEALRAGAGALVCIGLVGLGARLIAGGGAWTSPLLAAPVGASAVLLFAIPASPLAQPRAVIGGNVLSALIGVTCALAAPSTLIAAALAVGLAIGAMALLRCLHPPGGAVALTAVIGGSAVTDLGYGFVLVPIALCSVLAVAAAAAFHRLGVHSYPHQAQAPPASPHGTADPPPAQRAGFTPSDLDRALAEYGELLDVQREDLDALFRQVELRAHQRLHAQIRCADIMSRDVVAVALHQSAPSALDDMRQHDLRTAPVVDEGRRVVGMVRRAELQAGHAVDVAAVLDPAVHTVTPLTPIQALLPVLSGGAVHEAMVVSEDRTLLGIITQTDLLAVLYRAHVVEALVAERGQTAPEA